VATARHHAVEREQQERAADGDEPRAGGEGLVDLRQDARMRHPAETVSVLSQRMGVQDANVAGNVHGGWIMKLCDDVAAIAATRHAGGRVVTASVDGMRFRAPVHVGDVVTLRATVNAAWRTSMEVGVRVDAENVGTGEVRHVCTAYLTMVALGAEERPIEIPPLEPATEEERRRRDEAAVRRRVRLAQPSTLAAVSLER
jgi:acyl-CoA hydrolase